MKCVLSLTASVLIVLACAHAPASAAARQQPPQPQPQPTPTQEEKDARLLEAARVGKGAEVQAALDAGAHAEALDREGRTALIVAARGGQREAVDALLKARAATTTSSSCCSRPAPTPRSPTGRARPLTRTRSNAATTTRRAPSARRRARERAHEPQTQAEG